MFTTAHFIWLGTIAAVIAILLTVSVKCKIPTHTVHRVAAAVLAVLKVFHLSLSMKESTFGGLVISQTQLSFHLCSIMVYAVILTTFIKNEKLLATLKSFMTPCLMIGALMALLIPTEGVDAAAPRVWQYMLIHGVLVFYGIYLAFVEKTDLSLRAYLSNLKCLTVVMIAGFLMNSVLEAYGTNFLFLREPPMAGLPILNLDNGWYVYFLSLLAVACLLLFLVHLPYVVSRALKRKKEARPE